MSIDWNMPVETTEGRSARVVAMDVKGRSHPILALVTKDDGSEDSARVTLDGRCYLGGAPCFRNVPPKPVVTEQFISFHPQPCHAAPIAPSIGVCYPSIEYAEAGGLPGRHDHDPHRALIKVVITDGVVTGAELVKN